MCMMGETYDSSRFKINPDKVFIVNLNRVTDMLEIEFTS